MSQHPQNRTESEIGRILAQIDQEYQSAFLGLSGINVGTSRHDFINHRMENIGVAADELKLLVGEHEAGRLIVEQMNKSADRRQ